MTEQLDRKTAAFYLTLLALLILDAMFLVWMFSPLTHFGTRVYASEKPSLVSDTAKPSPFDFYSRKRTR